RTSCQKRPGPTDAPRPLETAFSPAFREGRPCRGAPAPGFGRRRRRRAAHSAAAGRRRTRRREYARFARGLIRFPPRSPRPDSRPQGRPTAIRFPPTLESIRSALLVGSGTTPVAGRWASKLLWYTILLFRSGVFHSSTPSCLTFSRSAGSF